MSCLLFLDGAFEAQKFKILMTFALSVFSFGCLSFWCYILKNIARSKVMKIYTYIFS